MKRLLLSLALFFAAGAQAQEAPYTVVTVDTRTEQLHLFLNDEAGKPFHSFKRLGQWLAGKGQQLVFAVNGGMYHADFSPVGLLVTEGREMAPLNLNDAFGNFFLKPNGVFLVTPEGPRVVESSEYPALAKNVRIATQSGPLLLRDGKIHPSFKTDATSRHIRNGVGIADGRALFVISEKPVTFHEFAVYMRDALGCRDALYLDGSISSMYDLSLKRHDARALLGPIIAVTRPLAPEK